MEPSPFRFLLCSVLLLILLHIPTSKSEASSLFVNCSTAANFTANSTFQSNLNHLLSTLPVAASPSGFYNTTVGQNGVDQVYGLALCRGDISASDCNACLTTAAQHAVGECPRGTSNTLWYDTCMLRYSNSSFFGVVDWAQIFAWNLHNVTDPNLFDDQLYQLMRNLSTEAAYRSGRPPMFAVGQVQVINSTNIYGLAQCTRDLSQNDCYGCLSNCIKSIPNCCATRIGGRIFGETCMIRFESAPFYNLSPIGNTTAPSPAPSGQNKGDGSKGSGVTRTIIILFGLMIHTTILLT
ncbi:cysteine-rich repeat secretory protein 38-like [Ananas comosus]|uniref:Cysteine-rich repeat secretory protein 38-like n=1 Tax=Ananas comosus TaxID=4615 RepID=A0A6P5F9C1_ANACO|nr:cysteine-rich repeat secretory protein 38-like [Ananas comosus]